MKSDWNLKVKVACPVCQGSRHIDDETCKLCNGTGRKFVEVPPKEIERFVSRPEKTEYSCAGCSKKEIILRPLEYQIPSGWVNWDGSLFCRDCRAKLLDAALVAVASKIQLLKERKEKNG